MSAGDVIKQFLVSLGYEVDEKGQQEVMRVMLMKQHF